MSWLNAISTANRETRNVEADNRKREQDIRNLQRMRQQDMDAATERDRQARGKADAQQDIPGFVDLPSGGMWGMNTPAAPQAPATQPPAARPGIDVNPMKASRYREVNKPTGAAPDQSMAESSRLARQAPPQKPGKLATSGYDAQSIAMAQRADEPSRATANRGAQQRRLSELVRKNPTTDTRRGEAPAETARLLRQPVPASPAQGGGTSAQEAFIAQYAEAAKRAGAQTGIDPKVLLAQWGLETGWGKSIVPGTNNLGNIKDFRGSGTAATDNMTGAVDKYRQFGSADEFADHYAGLVQRKYPGAIGAGSDMSKFAGAMKAGGYAEDPAYGAKLQQIHARMGAQPATAPGLPVQQPTQVAQGAQPIPTDAAAPQAQQVAQGAQQVDRGTVAGLSPEDDQALRVLRLQHSELARRLPYAKDIAEAQAIRDKLVTIVSGAQDIQVRNAATQAIDNDQALTSLARAAGVPFTQTPEGFVLVKPDGQGNWRAASPPADRMALITHITGVLTGSLAARAAEDRKAGYKVQESVATEQVKGLNKLREVAAKGQMDMQSELLKYQLTENDVKGVEFNPVNGAAMVRTTRGVFEVVPGGVGDLAGPSTLRPIQ
jgi:flagellum-specific peptidoglycan hydrolase FlgJ